MRYNKITPGFTDALKNIVGENHVKTGAEELERYSYDETEDLRFFPEVVVKPAAPGEVSAILQLCGEHQIPLTPRGAGTGLSGGSLAVQGGVSLSMERFNRILGIDERNLQATVEPGVITQDLMDAVEEKGFFYPVDPASKGSCFIGGNIAHGSGGPRVVKYGTIRDYVLNLEVVLPDGQVIWTGANTLKYASGYSLTQLMIGSEGTLGIITKAVLKLIPKPHHTALLLGAFPSAEKACEAVSAIFREGLMPSALEFMEKDAVAWVVQYEQVHFDLQPGINAYLLIEVDGRHTENVLSDCEQISEILYRYDCADVLFADTALQQESLWKIRRSIGVSVKSHSVYKEEDTVVPRAELPALLRGIKETGARYGFRSICYGHAGDGNLHVNIVKGAMSQHDWEHKLKAGIREIFDLTVSLGGAISGEHGIGLVQKEFMDTKFSPVHIDLMKQIKNVFDPKGILNPGKIFPDQPDIHK